jgi:hypothetical protein
MDMTVGKPKQVFERSVKLCIRNDDTDKITDSTFVFILFNEMNISQNVLA